MTTPPTAKVDPQATSLLEVQRAVLAKVKKCPGDGGFSCLLDIELEGLSVAVRRSKVKHCLCRGTGHVLMFPELGVACASCVTVTSGGCQAIPCLCPTCDATGVMPIRDLGEIVKAALSLLDDDGYIVIGQDDVSLVGIRGIKPEHYNDRVYNEGPFAEALWRALLMAMQAQWETP